MSTSNSSNNYSFGGGFLSLLTILFIGLKLVGVSVVAEWSWWWVLSPMWLPLVVVFGLLILVLLIMWIVSLFK